MAIIDSSTLISFARINKPDLLKLLKTEIITIQEVHEECVEKGIELGYADALKIKQMFSEKTITVKEHASHEKFSGVSNTDSKIISLAKEKADYLFADDAKLGRRAKAENIEVRSAPDILLHLTKTGRLTKMNFKALLQKLVSNRRMSSRAKNLYEKAGGI